MNRKPTLLAGAAVVALSVPGIATLRSTGAPRISTHVVARGPLRNEVLATGILQAVRSIPVTVPADLQRPMRIAWLAPAGPVKKGDTVVVFDSTEVEKQFEDGRSDRASAASKRRKAQAEGRQSGSSLGIDRAVAEEDLRRAEDVTPTDEQIFSRNEIVESRLDRTLLKKRLETTDAKRGPADRLAAADLALADIEGKKAELRVSQAEKSLKALKVAATHDGILIYPQSWRGDSVAVGDTVWPSQPIAELPDLSALEARVFVLEGDGGGLAAGQKANVEVEGQPGPLIEAKIGRVDALAKNRERQSPVKYFETVIPLDKGLESSRPARVLKPGLRVRATILVNDLQDVLAIPLGALFEKDGRRLVYRLEGRRFVPVDVVVGQRSLARVAIEKGLQPGDRIALHDPDRRTPTGAPSPGAAPAPAASR